MANFGPLKAEIGLGVLGTPANFNGFRVLALLLQRRHSSEANQTLNDVWPSPALVWRADSVRVVTSSSGFGQSQATTYISGIFEAKFLDDHL